MYSIWTDRRLEEILCGPKMFLSLKLYDWFFNQPLVICVVGRAFPLYLQNCILIHHTHSAQWDWYDLQSNGLLPLSVIHDSSACACATLPWVNRETRNIVSQNDCSNDDIVLSRSKNVLHGIRRPKWKELHMIFHWNIYSTLFWDRT